MTPKLLLKSEYADISKNGDHFDKSKKFILFTIYGNKFYVKFDLEKYKYGHLLNHWESEVWNNKVISQYYETAVNACVTNIALIKLHLITQAAMLVNLQKINLLN